MENNIKISIIIPMYNVEKYLKQCLDSAVNQTLSQIEIIIINDGSNDSSLEIAREYCLKYSSINLIEQKNLGQSIARNRGIDVARGKYIYFLDSDDYIEINAMKDLYKEAEKNDLDLILFNGISFYDQDLLERNKMTSTNDNYKKKYNYTNIMTGDECFAKLLHNKDYSCSPCLLFIRKSIINDNRIRFYEGIIHEDELFTFELMFKCNKVKCIDKTFFHRRIRDGSTTTGKQYLKSFIGCSTVLLKMMEFYNDSQKRKYIQDAIMINMSYMFGFSINRYCYMKSRDRKANSEIVSKIKEVAYEMDYFHRKDFKLFYYMSSIYILLRTIYDKFK